MQQRADCPPGASALVAGIYDPLNVMGSPVGTRVPVSQGEALPPAPSGWTWRLIIEGELREP
jgi:hypothetical protein